MNVVSATSPGVGVMVSGIGDSLDFGETGWATHAALQGLLRLGERRLRDRGEASGLLRVGDDGRRDRHAFLLGERGRENLGGGRAGIAQGGAQPGGAFDERGLFFAVILMGAHETAPSD